MNYYGCECVAIDMYLAIFAPLDISAQGKVRTPLRVKYLLFLVSPV